jgi:hypothetical protein
MYVFDLCYVFIYQFICDIDTDMIVCLLFCACADLAPRGHEVELQRASVQREPERLSRGERCLWDEATG